MGLSNDYGINANSLSEPYSLLASIFLIFGLAQLGLWLERIVSPEKSQNQLVLINNVAKAPIYGVCIFGSLLFPIVIFGTYARQLLFSSAISLCMTGIYFGYNLFKLGIFGQTNKNFRRFKARNFSEPQIYCSLILLCYALLSLSPPTDADDLDYHSGVALALLNQGTWPFSPEWFHSRLAGVGEFLIALGYSIGAKQFGSLLQFCGLACICSLFLRLDKHYLPRINGYMMLIFLSSPVLLWLTSTSKPLLLPIAMTTLALWHSTQPLRMASPSRRDLIIHFSIALFLLTLASQMKFNFLLSGFLVGAIAIYMMHRFNIAHIAVPLAAIIGGINMIPLAMWKQIHYGGAWYQNLYTLFPGNWPGYSLFETYLRHYAESNIIFPISLIISTPNQVTNVIGIGVVAWLLGLIWLMSRWSRLPLEVKILCCASIALTLIGSSLGQRGGRFYVEPLAWMLLAIIGTGKAPATYMSRTGLFALYLQCLITSLGLIVCIWTLLPGSLNGLAYQSIMLKRAYQYPEMESIDASLPVDAILLTDLRSIALSSRRTVSAFDWPNYVGSTSDAAHPYLDIIKNKGVTHLQTTTPLELSPWKDCIAPEPIKTIESQHNSRNPLNSGARYQVWLYSFDNKKLPACFKPLR